MASDTASNHSKKRLPPCVMELLDLAIYSFGALSGLRATDKVRGDPVVEGVCAMFGDLLNCASKETRDKFDALTAVRLGDWHPGTDPSNEVRQMVSSRLQAQKATGSIREYGTPVVPEVLLERQREYDETLDRVTTKRSLPVCWRCKKPCRCCKRKFPYVKRFCPDLAIPLLDVIDETCDNEDDEDSEDSHDESRSEENLFGYEDPGLAHADLYKEITSQDDIEDSEDSDGANADNAEEPDSSSSDDDA
ncbi:hypothetical protein AC249_AIPGENE17116 [Exaiptasia diaphana]|nr:hypothetical protein AC249_AIPGENE17116 [Exaiptasia diaphana]